jgi:hypothetical protein
MAKSSKIFEGVITLAAMSFMAYVALTSAGWETMSFDCQPEFGQVLCKIVGDPSPGQKRRVTIAKSQLLGVKVLERRNRGGIVNQVVLTTIDAKDIPLTQFWGGSATVQLLNQVDDIQTFIDNPQTQNLSLKTERDLISMAPAWAFCIYAAWGCSQALLGHND